MKFAPSEEGANFLAAVGVVIALLFVAILALVGFVAVLILIGFVTVLILFVHLYILQKIIAVVRLASMPLSSGFILGFTEKTHDPGGQNSSGDATGRGRQTTGEDAEKPLLINGFPDTVGNTVAKAQQRYGGSGTG